VGPDESQEILSPNVIIAVSVILSVMIIVGGILAYTYYFQPILKKRRVRAQDDESCENSSSVVVSESSFSEGGDQISLTQMNPLPIRMALFGSKKLRVTELISKGGFGYVYKGVYGGRYVAIKRIIAPLKKKDKLRLAKMFRTSLFTNGIVDEAATMNLMNHARIVEFIGAYLFP
jgi:serine/threonine protein kinase